MGRIASRRVPSVQWQSSQQVDALNPDALVVFDTDHFAILTSFEAIPVSLDLGRHVYLCGLDSGFDLTLTKEFTVDHSITVPLELLNAATRERLQQAGNVTGEL